MTPEKGKYYECLKLLFAVDNRPLPFTRGDIYLSKRDGYITTDYDSQEYDVKELSEIFTDTFEEVTPDVVDIHRRQGKVHEGLVSHPMHYNTNNPKIYVETDTGLKEATIECIDVIRNMPTWKGNVIKYAWRAGLKEEVGKSIIDKEIEDLEKAKCYIDDRINQLKLKQQYDGL